MSCDEEALTERLDGELSPERREAVDAHLAGCAACWKTLERLKAASAAFKEHGGAPAPRALAAAVLSGGVGFREQRGRTVLWKLAGAALSCTGVLLVSGKLFKPQIAGIFNQTMGMISGAAATVGADGGGSAAGAEGALDGLLAAAGAGGLALFVLGVLLYRRRR